MKLPNWQNAYIPKGKLTDYLLSENHPVGGSKARFFHRLGFSEKNATQLATLLLKIGKNNQIKNVREFVYGTNYMIEGTIETPDGKTVRIVTVWFIKTKNNRPSFVTAYPV